MNRTTYSKNSSRPEYQQREFEAHLAHVLDVRPDFLEGLLAKAEVLSFKPALRRQQGKIYAEAIKRANELLPVGFRGEISWGVFSNRFYHRLLYGAMIWHSHEGHTAKAVALRSSPVAPQQERQLRCAYVVASPAHRGWPTSRSR